MGISVLLGLGTACEALKPVDFNEGFDSGFDGPIDTDPTTDTVDTVDDTPDVNPDNTPPRANAGPDIRDLDGGDIWLDASGSSDLDGDPLTYEWILQSRPTGSNASIANPTQISTSIFLDEHGEYIVELIVNDGWVDASDRLVLEVDNINEPPVADAGPDQTVTVGSLVQLSGSRSSDPDRDDLDYYWQFLSRPNGSVATLAGATVQPADRPRFVADVVGIYELELVVDDGDVESTPDILKVTAEPSGSSGSGGSGGSTDCLDCAAEMDGRVAGAVRAGDAASALGLLLLPMVLLFRQRRRDS